MLCLVDRKKALIIDLLQDRVELPGVFLIFVSVL